MACDAGRREKPAMFDSSLRDFSHTFHSHRKPDSSECGAPCRADQTSWLDSFQQRKQNLSSSNPPDREAAREEREEKKKKALHSLLLENECECVVEFKKKKKKKSNRALILKNGLKTNMAAVKTAGGGMVQ